MFKQLDEYGAKVIKYLNDKHEQAVLVLSKERTNDFLHDYSDYFELFSSGIDEGIRLKEGVSVSQLWEKFRGYLSVDVMLAFMDRVSVSALGGFCLTKNKRFKDPIYGYIDIDESIVSNIVDTTGFQRLRNVIQTSYSPLYSSAVHNRFVHSLGVLQGNQTLCRCRW